MKIHFVPKRSFSETTVIGNATFLQFMAIVLNIVLFSVPFMISVNSTTVIIMLFGIGMSACMYAFFSHANESPVGILGIFFSETFIKTRPKKSTGRMPL